MIYCKDICKLFPSATRNYKDGRKSCRECGIFIKTTDTHCSCCGSPLAFKGRANINQLRRRAKNRLLVSCIHRQDEQDLTNEATIK